MIAQNMPVSQLNLLACLAFKLAGRGFEVSRRAVCSGKLFNHYLWLVCCSIQTESINQYLFALAVKYGTEQIYAVHQTTFQVSLKFCLPHSHFFLQVYGTIY